MTNTHYTKLHFILYIVVSLNRLSMVGSTTQARCIADFHCEEGTREVPTLDVPNFSLKDMG